MSAEPEWTDKPLSADEKGAHQAAALASGKFMEKPPSRGPVKTVLQHYAVPPEFDPRVIHHIEGYEANKEFLASAERALGAAQGGLQRLNEARLRAHELGEKGQWTVPQQTLQTSKQAGTLQDALLKQFDAARTDLERTAKALTSSLNAPIQGRADTVLAREVREYVKGLPTEKRHEFIRERIAKGDAKTVESILGAQGFLSGFDDNFIASYTNIWHEQQQPEIAKRLKAVQKAQEIVDARGAQIVLNIERAMRTTWRGVQEAQKANSEIERLMALVNNPVTP
jgi:hypothetical protein